MYLPDIFMMQYSMCFVHLQNHSHPCIAKLRFQFWTSAHTALVLRVLSVVLHHQQPLIQSCQHVAISLASFFFLFQWPLNKECYRNIFTIVNKISSHEGEMYRTPFKLLQGLKHNAQYEAILLHAISRIIISLWQRTADTEAMHGSCVIGTLWAYSEHVK